MDKLKNYWLAYYPESFVWRRALSTSIAVFFAMLIDKKFSMLHQSWVPLVTILITQLPYRSNLRQSLERALVVFLCILIFSVVVLWLQQPLFINIFVMLVFAACYSFYHFYTHRFKAFSISLMIAVVAILMLIPFGLTDKIHERMHDVILGCIVSLVASLLIFPSRPDVDFRKGVIPVLQAYRHYLSAIFELLSRANNADTNVQNAKIAVENILQARNVFFPSWVYELGFNLALQQGHRHFLIKIERLGQILFAMHQIARHPIDSNLLMHFLKLMQHYVEKANLLMELFKVRLDLKKIDQAVDDFSEDIKKLEETYREVINVPLELLDTSQDYIDIAAFIYDLKDFHKTLLSLAEALR